MADTTVKGTVLLGWSHPTALVLPNCMLVVETGPDAGKRFGPLRALSTIGRKVWCDIDLTDPQVSKQHCELGLTDRGVRVRDLESTNGVMYCGAQITDAVLPWNAGFQVGGTTLRLELQAGTDVRESDTMDPTCKLVGASAPMRRLFGLMRRVGPTEMPVLILGDTGTGKTQIAQSLHQISPRRRAPFVKVNCGAIPAELFESEMFGHVRGAFTGAHRDSQGYFARANHGSLFLDEIGDLPLAQQVKLLTVLDSGRVLPVGGDREVPFDVRLICATNRDIEAEVAAGRFRRDLFYRISTMQLTVPALSERKSDIPMLAEWLMVQQVNKVRATTGGCAAESLSPEAMRAL